MSGGRLAGTRNAPGHTAGGFCEGSGQKNTTKLYIRVVRKAPDDISSDFF